MVSTFAKATADKRDDKHCSLIRIYSAFSACSAVNQLLPLLQQPCLPPEFRFSLRLSAGHAAYQRAASASFHLRSPSYGGQAALMLFLDSGSSLPSSLLRSYDVTSRSARNDERAFPRYSDTPIPRYRSFPDTPTCHAIADGDGGHPDTVFTPLHRVCVLA